MRIKNEVTKLAANLICLDSGDLELKGSDES